MPTFVAEDALHLHAAPGVGDAQGTAGYSGPRPRATGQWSAPTGTSQALSWGRFQNFHGLAAADGELSAVAGREVMDHHGQRSQPPDSWGGEGTGQPVCPHHGPAAGKAGTQPSCVRAQDAG